MENKYIYCVYIHTNITNSKKYVGITKQDPNVRWGNGNGYKGNQRFTEDIEKYGWDGFTHEIVESGLSKMDAEILEAELIEQYKSDKEEFGYNISSGKRYPTDLNDDSKTATFSLRIPKSMKAQLEYIANSEYRTINGMITYICAKYIEKFNENND